MTTRSTRGDLIGALSAALTMTEKLGHIALDPCSKMGLRSIEADVTKREPCSLGALRRISSTTVYMPLIGVPISGCGLAACWLPLLALFTGARHADQRSTDSPRKMFRSSRHLFVMRLRAAVVDRDVVRALVGYADRDVTVGYGRVDGTIFPVAVLRAVLEKVRVDDVDLSHLQRSPPDRAA